MYSVSIKKDIYDIYILSDDSTSSTAEICPVRGGILKSFVSKGTELLYLDQSTFYDESNIDIQSDKDIGVNEYSTANLKNIRGGNPILFPICGQLPDKRYLINDKEYFINNHGFARNNPWVVLDYGISQGNPEYAFLKIGLSSNLNTLESYPFDFRLVYTYILKSGKLTIEQSIMNTTCHSSNTDDIKMPVHTGFHPYFKVSSKILCHNIKSRECFDYNDMKSKYFSSPYNISGKKEAILVRPEISGDIEFYDYDNPEHKIQLTYSPEYKYIMLWAQDDSDFICVEPWTAKNQEILRDDELISLQSGNELKLFMSIEKV